MCPIRDISDIAGISNSVTEEGLNCLDESPVFLTDVDDTYFSFTFTECHTPKVKEITPSRAVANGVLTIYGSGFSTVPAQNRLTFERDGARKASCLVTDSSETRIVCGITDGSSLQMGILLSLNLQVANKGSALFVEPEVGHRGVTLMPYIESVSPAKGSRQGNMLVTISGGGFGSDVTMATVVLANTRCNVQTVVHDQIFCLTEPSYQSGEVHVTVATVFLVPDGSKYDLVSVASECVGICEFSFTEDTTPYVLSVSPDTIIDVIMEVNIRGTGFGSDTPSSVVSVGMADTDCIVSQVTDNEITCALRQPIAGTHTLNLNIEGKGDAQVNNLQITVEPVLYSISPASGSTEGGTIVTIHGLGFVENDTNADVGGTACEIIHVTRSDLVCVTSIGSAGTVAVSVTTTSIAYPIIQYTYSSAQTPAVTAVQPGRGSADDVITISGSGFGVEIISVTVTIGDAHCNVIAVVDTSLDCTLPANVAGEYDVLVTVAPKGRAAGDVVFEYKMELISISPTAGEYIMFDSTIVKTG